MSLTPYGRHVFLRCAFTTDSMPATVYWALTVSTPSSSDDGVLLARMEPVATTNYARVAYTVANGFDFSTYGEMTNVLPIQFPTPSTDWGMLRGWAMCDAATSGRVLFTGTLRQPRRAAVGTALIMGVDALRLTVR